MTKANLLVNLFKAGARGNVHEFQAAADGIIAEERLKKHGILADRLAEIIRTTNAPAANNARLLEPTVAEYISEIVPERRLNDIFFKPAARALIDELVEEQQRADVLKSYGLLPRHKIMLLGPPGNGKTACAEAIAHELAQPLLVVNYDGVIGKFLGETSSRLKKVFEYARQTHCVLFFDEFDALGKERGDAHETGEIKRVVSSLLLQIDKLPYYTTVIVASNHGHLLDSAMWRRFQARVEMPPPTEQEKTKFIERFARKTQLNFGMAEGEIAKKLRAQSYAEVEEFCLDVLRRAILSLSRENAKHVVGNKMKQWDERERVKNAATKAPIAPAKMQAKRAKNTTRAKAAKAPAKRAKALAKQRV